MSMSFDECARDQALQDLHFEAMMERAKKEQCIFLFVEGESEEIAFPELLYQFVDLEEIGVVIANYNGHGNLHTSLRLLLKTLSHDRPVIVTYDNDPDGFRVFCRCHESDFMSDKITFFPIPQIPVVIFQGGHEGGSFEESFRSDEFIEAYFCSDICTSSAKMTQNNRFKR
ncbi:MAG: hypothetical protein JXA82_15615 [Sedimentisphaerales bacterium]|nr:hypothetical protein [Sedimentisphaerales bacterium]